MRAQWHYQLPFSPDDPLAELARRDPAHPTLEPLTAILNKHGATMASQLDAFEAYIAQAEREGPGQFPLYQWTKATLAHPVKRRKHLQAFALRVAGHEVYPRASADPLEADLPPLVGGPIVPRLSRQDTTPANNIPVPAEYRS